MLLPSRSFLWFPRRPPKSPDSSLTLLAALYSFLMPLLSAQTSSSHYLWTFIFCVSFDVFQDFSSSFHPYHCSFLFRFGAFALHFILLFTSTFPSPSIRDLLLLLILPALISSSLQESAYQLQIRLLRFLPSNFHLFKFTHFLFLRTRHYSRSHEMSMIV